MDLDVGRSRLTHIGLHPTAHKDTVHSVFVLDYRITKRAEVEGALFSLPQSGHSVNVPPICVLD